MAIIHGLLDPGDPDSTVNLTLDDGGLSNGEKIEQLTGIMGRILEVINDYAKSIPIERPSPRAQNAHVLGEPEHVVLDGSSRGTDPVR